MRKREADILEIKELFIRCFGAGEDVERIYFAPGRINIIGEHIDYNGGFVMPCAINRGTYLAAGPNGRGTLRFFSCSHQQTGVYEFPSVSSDTEGSWQKTGQWVDYPRSVLELFRQEGFVLDGGYDFLYCGDLPEGAGFSSSASIELATAMALNDIMRNGETGEQAAFGQKELALLCCRAENQLIGVRCGVMDQLAVALGRQDCALMLDTASLEYEYIPMKCKGVRIVAVNTGVARNLSDGAYNAVRDRSRMAAELMGAQDGLLCRMDPEQVEPFRKQLEAEGVYPLVRHMINENARTVYAGKAVEDGDIQLLGQLLKESHESLKDDMEVSCYELDVLAETANDLDGVIGARMMGGGFGGCVLALVEEWAVRSFKRELTSIYTRKTDMAPVFYDDLQISDGAALIYEKTISHPRPAMKRSSFMDLNGLWEYAITKEEKAPENYQGSILVPYSPETALSGVGKQLQPGEYLHYHLAYVPGEDAAEKLQAGTHRLHLHFGAVDQTCIVYVNDREAGRHRGGYTPFFFDITEHVLAAGVWAHQDKDAPDPSDRQTVRNIDLKVTVRDISDTGHETTGKQRLQSGGMFYTAQSGIWQSVWMEVVPQEHISKVRIKPDIDNGSVLVMVSAAGISAERTGRGAAESPEGGAPEHPEHSASERLEGDTFEGAERNTSKTCSGNVRIVIAPHGAAAPWDTGALVTTELPVGKETAVALPDAMLWTPETPVLYDMKIDMGSDTVYSYFAMRKVSVGKDAQGISRILLNNRPYFVNGVLDQGYWHQGLYTAPDEEALFADIDRMKKLGFNCLRKHVKVEPQIWYHRCDKVGMLVMQDMVNGGGTPSSMRVAYLPNILPRFFRGMKDDKYKALRRDSRDSQKQYLDETREMIESLSSFPCIIAWVPFNEGWGQFDSRSVTEFVRALDDTRLIDSASGWFDQGCGDLYSIHNYFLPLKVAPQGHRAVALTEYGGTKLLMQDHFYGNKKYGYGGCRDKAALSQKYREAFQKDVLENISRGLCMSIYTQLSDVQDEINGIYTFDREVLKFQEGLLEELNAQINAMNAEAEVVR